MARYSSSVKGISVQNNFALQRRQLYIYSRQHCLRRRIGHNNSCNPIPLYLKNPGHKILGYQLLLPLVPMLFYLLKYYPLLHLQSLYLQHFDYCSPPKGTTTTLSAAMVVLAKNNNIAKAAIDNDLYMTPSSRMLYIYS